MTTLKKAKKLCTSCLLLILLFSIMPSAMSVWWDELPGEHPPWYWWTEPPLPDLGCNVSYFTDITPPSGEEDVVIDVAGVLICANITPPPGCTINVSYQWFDYDLFYEDWLAWANAQYWGSWDDFWEWYYLIDFDNETDWTDSIYWHHFVSASGINTTTQICAHNINVSCQIENDYTREFFDWRINYTLNCSGVITSGDCNYYFEAEFCENVTYIYPPSPNGTVCPCCDDMCISVNNVNGNLMNLSFYRNDSQFENFYRVNQITNVPNGTYCFCIDGHICECRVHPVQGEVYYFPMMYNETYHWYVNITDTVTENVITTDIFTFRTPYDPDDCPCGIADFVYTADDLGLDEVKDDTWIVGLILVSLVLLIPIFKTRRR